MAMNPSQAATSQSIASPIEVERPKRLAARRANAQPRVVRLHRVVRMSAQEEEIARLSGVIVQPPLSSRVLRHSGCSC